MNTPVWAAASGTVVSFGKAKQKCIPRGLSPGCKAWGAVGIRHGNGYITQYLHMSIISVSAGQTVTQGQALGLSGSTAPKKYNLPAHLHFEVLKQKDGTTLGTSQNNDYVVVDPYGWTGLCPDQISACSDPLEAITHVKNIKLWQ
jgi:murein DD-endopeptidase MepM/ murein hydrolase activator NlpD